MTKTQLFAGLFIILLALGLGIGCAPGPKPAPTPAPAAPTPVAAPAAPKPAATVSAEEAAWAQVVSNAKKEGKLTLYTWGVTGQAGVRVGRAFKEAYGIEIESITGLMPTLMERVKTEQAAGKNVTDTFDGSPSMLVMVRDAGLSQPIGYLPALAQKGDFRQDPIIDPEGHLMAVGLVHRIAIINSNLVRPQDEPRSYREFLEPKWKGKMVVPSPVTAVGINYIYAVKDKLGLDDDYFRRLAKNDLIVVATDKEAVDMVMRGEAHLAPSEPSILISSAVAKGAPGKCVFPMEGVLAHYGNTWAAIKNAPHPNAAKLFLNWLLTPQGQSVYGEAMAWTPIRKDVPDYVPAPLQVPAGAKLVSIDLPTEMRVSDLRRERTLAILMGIK